MSAEGMPPEEEPSIFARPLAALTRGVLRYSVATLVLCTAAAAVCVLYAARRVDYRTSRLDLLNPQSGYNQLWLEYIQEFGAEDDAVVVVEGASRDQVVPALQELSGALVKEKQLFHAVLHEIDLSPIRSKALHYLPAPELQGIEGFLDKLSPILEGDWSNLNLGRMTLGMCMRLGQPPSANPGQPAVPQAPPSGPAAAAMQAAAQAELGRLARGLAVALTEPGKYQSPWPEMPHSFATLSELGSQYLLTEQGRLGFIMLRLVDQGETGLARNQQAIAELRKLIAQVGARHPDVAIGLTGLPVMEHDEMQVSQMDMQEATILGLIGVFVLFAAGLGGLRHALLSTFVVGVGMAWSVGYLAVAVGHLNILSSAFAVVLIGQGNNYPIHYVARYLHLRRRGPCDIDLIARTARDVGPGVFTSGVATALSFFAIGYTEFTGVAELGTIGGGGILCCMVATLLVLPAVIYLWDRHKRHEVLPESLRVDLWAAPLLKVPLTAAALTLVITGLTAFGLPKLWYDHNLLNLQAQGLESVELERKLLEDHGQSVWFALSVAESREELLARKAKFLQLPTVERTEEIVSLLPADHEHKRPAIQRIDRRLANLAETPQLIPVDSPENLGRALSRARGMLPAGPESQKIIRDLDQIRDVLRRLPPQECYARISGYQQQMAGDLLSRMHFLREVADPNPPELGDLPQSLVTRFVGQGGRHLLKIYARDNTWDMEALAKFVADVRSVDPRATGNPLQTYEASQTMQRSYLMAALYSVVGIVVAIWLDFRSVRHTLLAMLPLGLGMVQTFGLMGLMDIPLNPANMIALPLLIGVGVEDGVHIVHDYRSQSGRYRLTPSTTIAMMLTSLTTVASFASLMIASHRGLYSLGRIMTLGATCCLLTSVILLPAFFVWLTRNRPDPVDAQQGDEPGEGEATARRIEHRHRNLAGPHRMGAPGLPRNEEHDHAGFRSR